LEALPLSLDIAVLLRLPQEAAAPGLMPPAWSICRPVLVFFKRTNLAWLTTSLRISLNAKPIRAQADRAISNVGGSLLTFSL
jgi:hypothetical protein